ncbi:MAG: aminopeptidase [Planctomycetes bacterium]|nr:aminopeptidase [Planctomycetota bacterium]
MTDPRYRKLASLLVHHSTRIKPGDKVLVEAFDIPEEFLAVLIRSIAEAGGVPLCMTKHNRVLRELFRHATEEGMEFWASIERAQMEGVQVYMGVRGALNVTELSDVPADQMALFQRTLWKKVHTEVRIRKTRWVVLRWPSPSMAQLAKMSTEAFEDFYFDVCTVDYAAMERAMQPLRERMEKAKRVHIAGPGTDLRFSIEGIPVIGCAGTMNIPDGEMFTAPVRDSVEGKLSVNTQSLYYGMVFDHIALEFRRGRIETMTANHQKRLEEILNSDEGGRYIGEFSIAFNPKILHPLLDTLFDEKIAGSFHFTPGQAYEEADNGNRSGVHWDLVTIQRPEYGGGEIRLDGELIRKDGLFVPEDLQGLNPESFPKI